MHVILKRDGYCSYTSVLSTEINMYHIQYYTSYSIDWIRVHTTATLWTNHSCILKMKTVMDANPTVRAVSQVSLISSAGDFIQEDGSISRIKDDISYSI